VGRWDRKEGESVIHSRARGGSAVFEVKGGGGGGGCEGGGGGEGGG
jgi:hypothetical protein